MTKHTPGPWKVLGRIHGAGCPRVEIRLVDVNDYNHTHRPGIVVRGDNAETDAKLIAAAPDLLEALEALATLATDISIKPGLDSRLGNVFLLASKAISKAKGYQ